MQSWAEPLELWRQQQQLAVQLWEQQQQLVHRQRNPLRLGQIGVSEITLVFPWSVLNNQNEKSY
jgi:hypothetical protein